MKIIDKKGRLFGKINVIDFMVILVFLFLVPAFYFGYKLLYERPRLDVPEREFIDIETNFRLIKLKPELLEIISVGDRELDKKGQVIGEIISLNQIVPYKYEFDLGGDQKIIKEDPILKQIDAKLKLKAEFKEGRAYYKKNEIKIGSPLKFITSKYSLLTVPVEVIILEERFIDLYVILKDINEDTLQKISIGNKELDERGNVVAEILSLGKIESSSTEFDFGSGNLVRKADSSKKQIFTEMRIKCQIKDNNQLYYKDKMIKIGSSFVFKTNEYALTAVPSEKEKEWVSLQVKFSNVVPEIAKFVQKGDREKDAYEQTITRINSIISNQPAQITTIYEEKFITLSHPFNKDILISIDVLCIEKEGEYFYKDSLLKIGNNIAFTTELYSISGLIVGIQLK